MSATQIPTPTTATHTNDNGTYERTVWTVGEYDLVHISKKGSTYTRWTVETADHKAPTVDEGSSWGSDDRPATYEVNWSSRGSQSPSEARAYAERIIAATVAAEIFEQIRSSVR